MVSLSRSLVLVLVACALLAPRGALGAGYVPGTALAFEPEGNPDTPSDVLRICDEWIHERLDERFAKIRETFGADPSSMGAAIQLELEGRVQAKIGALLHIAMKGEPKFVLEQTSRGAYRLHVAGELSLRGGLSAGSNRVEAGIVGRRAYSYEADPRRPGELFVLANIIAFGGQQELMELAGSFLQAVPSNRFGRIGKALGFVVKKGQQAIAHAAGTSGADSVRDALNSVDDPKLLMERLKTALEYAPKMNVLEMRDKHELGGVFEGSAGWAAFEAQAEREAIIGTEIRHRPTFEQGRVYGLQTKGKLGVFRLTERGGGIEVKLFGTGADRRCEIVLTSADSQLLKLKRGPVAVTGGTVHKVLLAATVKDLKGEDGQPIKGIAEWLRLLRACLEAGTEEQDILDILRTVATVERIETEVCEGRSAELEIKIGLVSVKMKATTLAVTESGTQNHPDLFLELH